MSHIFPKEKGITEIMERYSSWAHLVTMSAWNELVWFMDGYVDKIWVLYDRELDDHYWNIGIENISNMVREGVDGILPEVFFSCSSSWTRERYMNMIHIYNLLQKLN